VAIAGQPLEHAQGLKDKLSIDVELLADPDLIAITAFGVADGPNGTAWPAIFLVDTDGKIAWRDIRTSYKVRPTSALILQAIDDLGDAQK